MNYFEFKQQLKKDSFTKDEEFHRLRKEDLRCAKAYEQAMIFEKTLKNAFTIKTPDNLRDSIVLRQSTQLTTKWSMQKYAIAATVFLTFIIASTTWYMMKPKTVEQFIANSIAWESNVPMTQYPIPLNEVKKVFADFQTELVDKIGNVHFIHDCHTPGGTGVHMVIATLQGPVTIYYMPNTTIKEGRINFEIEDAKAILVAMQKGSIAIVADTQQQLASIEPILQNNLSFL